jgi:hypothetical protein
MILATEKEVRVGVYVVDRARYLANNIANNRRYNQPEDKAQRRRWQAELRVYNSVLKQLGYEPA